MDKKAKSWEKSKRRKSADIYKTPQLCVRFCWPIETVKSKKNEPDCGFMVTQSSFKLTATPELLDWLCGIYSVPTGFSHKSAGLSPDNTERIIKLECGLSRCNWRRRVLNASPSPGSKEGGIPLSNSLAEKDEEELKLEEEPASVSRWEQPSEDKRPLFGPSPSSATTENTNDHQNSPNSS